MIKCKYLEKTLKWISTSRVSICTYWNCMVFKLSWMYAVSLKKLFQRKKCSGFLSSVCYMFRDAQESKCILGATIKRPHQPIWSLIWRLSNPICLFLYFRVFFIVSSSSEIIAMVSIHRKKIAVNYFVKFCQVFSFNTFS